LLIFFNVAFDIFTFWKVFLTKQYSVKKVIALHGEIAPFSAGRLVSLRDGEVIDLGAGRRLKMIHSRGMDRIIYGYPEDG